MIGADPDSFESLYERTYPRVLAYVIRRMTGREDAADVVAETYVTAWRKFDVVPQDDTAVLWLYAVARRMMANHRRGSQRRDNLVERLSGHIQLSMAALPQREPGDDSLKAALGRLRPGDREVLLMVAWEQLDRDEIATVLGCSRTAVRVRLHRARARHATELTNAVSDTPDRLKRSPAAGHSSLRGAVQVRPDTRQV